MNRHKEKGQYGYRDYRRRLQLAKVLLGAAMILAQAGARGFTDNQAAKNILTVMAVLSVLPTANLASPLLASWKHRTPPESFYEQAEGRRKKGLMLYDLIVTSREQIIPLDVVAIRQDGVFACCGSERTDTKKAETYLNDTFKAHGLAPNVKLISGQQAFFKRLDSLGEALKADADGSVGYAAGLLKNLSM